MAPPPRSIVVAADAREGSKDAFKWALRNLVRDGDNIFLVNVRPTPHTSPLGGVQDSFNTGDDADQGYTAAVEAIFHELVQIAKESDFNVECHKVVRSGDPREVILSEVTLHDASALVMGSRGLKGMQRAFLGSVSEYCARHAATAVIIVRDQVE